MKSHQQVSLENLSVEIAFIDNEIKIGSHKIFVGAYYLNWGLVVRRTDHCAIVLRRFCKSDRPTRSGACAA